MGTMLVLRTAKIRKIFKCAIRVLNFCGYFSCLQNILYLMYKLIIFVNRAES